MISFEPGEEETALRDVAHRFAAGQMRPLARACEDREAVGENLLHAFREIGLALLGCPESCGGVALGARAQILVEEELAWGDAGICAGLPRPSVVASVLDGLAHTEQRRWLAPLLADHTRYACAALIEASPDAPWGIGSTASEDGTVVDISGWKDFVLGVDRSEWMLLSCVLAGEPALVAIPVTTTGLNVLRHAHPLGLRAASPTTVSFDHARVPREQVLATGQQAAKAISHGATHDLLLWTARALGTARAAFEYAARYATERSTFGKPIAEHQAVAFLIADMNIRVDAARTLLWQAAWGIDTKSLEATDILCSAALFAADVATEVTSDAVQTLGGHGYVQDHPVEQWMRDARSVANVAIETASFLRRINARLSV